MRKLVLLSLTLIGAFVLGACTPADEEAPVITLDSDAVVEYVQDATEPDWASLVSATDNVDESIDVTVDDANVDMATPGTFTVTFSAVDEAGNAAEDLVVTITIVDETDPVIALVTNAQTTYGVGDDAPDWASLVTATDNTDGALSVTVNDLLVDMDTVGSFFVQFTAEDAAGNDASLSVEFFIVDEEVPVITLNNDAVVDFFIGDAEPTWASLVTVEDNYDTSITVSVDDSNVDMSVPGTFDVTYSATDSEGNVATPLVVTVTVTNEMTYMFDFEDIEINAENGYGNLDNPDGYGWFVIEDPNDAENQLASRAVGDESKGGRLSFPTAPVAGLDFELEFDMAIIDSSLGPVPVLALDAAANPYVNFNNNLFLRYKDGAFEAISIIDGNWNFLTEAIPFPLTDGQFYHFEVSMMGTHLVVNVDDTLLLETDLAAAFVDGEIYFKNNKAFYLDNVMITTYDNSYMADTTAPVLSVNEVFTLELYEGSDPINFDYLAKISENSQAPFTMDIVGVDAVDMNTPGTYDITYTATDDAGNVSEPLTITITILEMPEINLAAGAVVDYELDTTAPDWTTLVETAFADDYTLTVDSSLVDMATVGAYDITYTLDDAEGNAFVTFVLTVTVFDPSATPEAIVADAKANLDLGDLSAVTTDLVLPTSDPNTATITWASDNEAVIATDGTVTQPTTGSGDATVTLTATISSGDYSETKDFVVTVPEASAYTTLFSDDFESTTIGTNPSNSVNYGKGIKAFDLNGNVTLNIAADGTAMKIWEFNLAGYTEVVITMDYYVDSTITTTKIKGGLGLFPGADVLTVKPVDNKGVLHYRPNNPDFYAADLFSDGTITQTTLNTDEWYTWKMVMTATTIDVYLIDSSDTETLLYTLDRSISYSGSDIYFGIQTERIDTFFDNLLIEVIS